MSWWDEQDEKRRAAISAILDAERGAQYLRHANDDRGFAAWLLVADTICVRRFGFSLFDLADWHWRDAYDSGQKPAAAVREALHADGAFATLIDGE